MLNDLRYALRRLAKSPGYVVMAVLALALGIGANANVFSFVNAYLIRPLPQVRNIDRVTLLETRIRTMTTGVSYLDFLDLSQNSRSFEAFAATLWTSPTLTGRGEPERLTGSQVSSGYFDLFTVQPAVGRAFFPSDTGAPIALISDRLWQRRFGSSPSAIGQSLTLDGVNYEIVGVMPPRFRSDWNDLDIWLPLSSDVPRSPRARRNLDIFARLKPGVPLATAQQEISTVAARLEMQYPDTNAAAKIDVLDYVEQLGAGPRQSLDILVYVVAFVLLIACSNVANLQLARATGRASEIAIRMAMGANRWRIIRQVLFESTIVAILGGALGLAFSFAGAKILVAYLPQRFAPINNTLLDGHVVLYTAAIALGAGILSGIAPAFQVSRVGVSEVLKEAGRGNTGGLRGRIRSSLVVVEVTLALVLLLASGLLIQSFRRIQDVDPGFRADRLLVANIYLPETKYTTPEQRSLFFRNLVDRVSHLPGARAAAATSSLPMMGGGTRGSLVIEGEPVPAAGSELVARNRSITPAYFQTMGVSLRRGRYFSDQDVENTQPVAIVNERLAQQFFSKSDPLGKRIKFGKNAQSPNPWLTIVGVAADVKPFNLVAPPVPEVFLPQRQAPGASSWIVVRTEAPDPTVLAGALRGEIRALDRDQPVTNLRSMESVVDETKTLPRLMATLMAIFAGIAAAMAALGIYGVISYSVAQRTHELGIRMALGAASPTVIRLVLRQSLWMLGIGVGIGLPAAAATTRFLQGWLYGVGARDPMIFITIPLGLAVVGAIASYIPARRATRIDPVVALRCE